MSISPTQPRSSGIRGPTVVIAAIHAAICLLAGHASAQCPGHWLPGGGVRGVDGEIFASTLWDPDGSGPLPPVLVVGGSFHIAGFAAASNIAAWNPATGLWSPLGSGTNATVRALETLPTGELVVGGELTTAGGIAANHIALWNGSAWSSMGSGLDGIVRALAVLPDGGLVAGGSIGAITFPMTGWVSTWHGDWVTIAPAITHASNHAMINCLAVLPNGEIVAGGRFSTIGGLPFANIARWTASGWAGVGTGVNGAVFALLPFPDGQLIAGGDFSKAGSSTALAVARWNGAQWFPVGELPTCGVRFLRALSGGNIIAAGCENWNGSSVAAWNGLVWEPLGEGPAGSPNTASILPDGRIIVAGSFASAGGVEANNVASWNGTTWSAMPAIPVHRVGAMLVLPDGGLVAALSGTQSSGVVRTGVARWNNGDWFFLGSGPNIRAGPLASTPNGDIVTLDRITHAVLRWDGAAWTSLGSISGYGADAIAALANGEVLIGGSLFSIGGARACNVARWNGTSWSALSDPAVSEVISLVVLHDGSPALCGFNLNSLRFFISRRSGTLWRQLGEAGAYNASLIALPSGGLAASGLRYNGGIARLTESGWWLPLGSGIMGETGPMAVAPDASLLVGSSVQPGGLWRSSHIARWNGSTWTELAPGINAPAQSLAVLPSGELLASGNFTTIGGVVSAYFARYDTLSRCDADFNCSFSLETQDIFDFLNAWFADEPRADFNTDAHIDAGDIYSFLSAWFAGCP